MRPVSDKRPASRAFSLKTKFIILLALVFIGFVMPRFMAFYIIDAVKIGSPLYRDIVTHKELIVKLQEIQTDINHLRAEWFHLVDESQAEKKEKIIEAVEQVETGILNKFTFLESESHGELQKGVVAVKASFKEIDEEIDGKLKPLLEQKDEAGIRALLISDQTERIKSINEQINGLRVQAQTAIKAEEEKAASLVKGRISVAMLISLALFVMVIVPMLALAVSIARTLKRSAAFADGVSRGDLTRTLPVDARDEIGTLTLALNSMVENLNGLVIRVSDSSRSLTNVSDKLHLAATQVARAAQTQKDEIGSAHASIQTMDQSIARVGDGVDVLLTASQETSSAILEITASIDNVADTVEQLSMVVDEVSSSILEMAASVKQVGTNVLTLVESSSITASSILEMDASIRQVQENASTTARIAVEVRQDAETGRQAMEATMAGMIDIRRSSQITSEVIDTLSAKTGDIGDILSVIDEVAEQTNLLALNAAIIAAQAGEHGKGFAVVADEIKELADRTTSSTKEIGDVIKAVQEDTLRAVDAIAAAERAIKDGEFLSGRSAEALDKITSGVQQASERMNQIAVATSEQSKGSKVIRDAMEHVSSMIEQIATATREQGRGSEVIIQAVERMKILAGQVKQATREQSNAGSTIGNQTERVNEIVMKIRTDCASQRQEGARIVQSMDELRATNQANLEATAVMGQAVTTLVQQTEALQQEILAFSVAQGEEHAGH